MSRLVLVLAAAASLLVAACTGPILANPPVDRPTAPPTPPPPPVAVDPIPVELPRDDGPHRRLTEWWYYTGHLREPATGATYGFEYVIFRAERGDFPVTWASHLAITDEGGDRFLYAERAEIGPQVDRSPRDAAGVPTGFELAVSGLDPTAPEKWDGSVWAMRGGGGADLLAATSSEAEAARVGASGRFGLELLLREAKPPVLHDRDGWIDFGPAGGSYYYSRTRMAATGTLTLDGRTVEVVGDAWFDHQWGDFISVGGGGWDWFAVNLADGTDLTISLVRDADGSYPLIYGTLVDAAGRATHLERDDLSVEVTRRWRSPATGIEYPAGWTIRIPAEALEVGLVPTVAAQELDTRATTGVVYWEGSQVVTARRGGVPLDGEAYVELTGYAPVP